MVRPRPGLPGQSLEAEVINRRTPIAEHVLSCGPILRYVLLRSDGLPEIREVRGGVDRIVSQKFVRIPLPPPDRWWERITEGEVH